MEECTKDTEIGLGTVADATVFVGDYPFSGEASADWQQTCAGLQRAGIEKGIVSPIEAVFREDFDQVESQLCDALSNLPQWRVFKTINPLQPWWRGQMRMKDHPFAGIRLFALYHGYSLSSPLAMEVFDFAREHALPVQVFCRMQDSRMQYGHLATEVSMEEVHDVLTLGQKGNTVLLSGLGAGQINQLVTTTQVPPNVFFDTSRLQGAWKTFEMLGAETIAKHLVFGSLWPINCPECPLTQIKYAKLGSCVRDAVVRGNFERFIMCDLRGPQGPAKC